MSTLSELKQFLEIYILRDRSQRLLQLSQEAYIEKIANQYKIDLIGRLPNTPIVESKLLPTDYRSIRPTLPSPNIDLLVRLKSLLREVASTILYQKKIGLVLYIATTIRPDITFIVLRLVRFNQDPSQEYYRAADRVI